MFLSNRRNSGKKTQFPDTKKRPERRFLETNGYIETISGQEIFRRDNSGNLKFQKDSKFQIFGQDKFWRDNLRTGAIQDRQSYTTKLKANTNDIIDLSAIIGFMLMLTRLKLLEFSHVCVSMNQLCFYKHFCICYFFHVNFFLQSLIRNIYV